MLLSLLPLARASAEVSPVAPPPLLPGGTDLVQARRTERTGIALTAIGTVLGTAGALVAFLPHKDAQESASEERYTTGLVLMVTGSS